MEISLIAALDNNNLIGAGGEIPWHLPADLRYFKATTMGKPLLMGRKTYESIGKPLPGRHNIVLTRRPNYQAPRCTVVHSIPAALAAAGDADELMVIGGGAVYEALLPHADRLYLTYVDALFDGDTYFPPISPEVWQVVSEEAHPADAKNPYPYRFVVLERRK
jgi:dihydrofolate reductase